MNKKEFIFFLKEYFYIFSSNFSLFIRVRKKNTITISLSKILKLKNININQIYK
jgi:hypothetical protein